MTALALLAAAACLATPVVTSESGRTIVRAGPFQGDLQPRYDVVAGRFSLRAGGHRVGGGSQKIGWLVYSRRAAGDTMVVTGRRLAGPPQTFTQEFTRAWAAGITRPFFPSIISPPSAGCWRLTFRSGNVTGALTVLVRPRPAR